MTTADARTRRRAVAVAGHTGDEQYARVALEDVHHDVRASALLALSRLGALTSDDLQRCLRDSAPSVRRRSCELAATHSVVDLTSSLIDADPSVVEAAAWACGEQRPQRPGVVAALASVASDNEDALARESAVAALGALGDPAGLETILDALDDKAPIRRRAVLALAPFEGDTVTAALDRALNDRDWQVRQAAEDLQVASEVSPL